MRGPALALYALLAALACAAPAAAAPGVPGDLQVRGETDIWHPDNRFAITWTLPPGDGGPPVTAVRYRVRDPHGVAIREDALFKNAEGVWDATVPRAPGVYGFEVWLEDAAGARGPAATAKLRFDDTRPGPVGAPSAPSWIGRTAFPLRVRLDHPEGPSPPAGIKGYAVALGTGPGLVPCAAADRCANAETALQGGVEDDVLTIAALPEGVMHLSAVAVSGSGMKSSTPGRTVLRVDATDPATVLIGAPDGWTNRAVELTALAVDLESGMKPAGGPPPYTAIQIDAGAPAVATGGSVAASAIDEGAHRVAYYARDAAGNVDDGGRSNGIDNAAPRTAWVRIDRTPPLVAFANSQRPDDPDLIRARVSDPLSGPDLSRGTIGVRRAGSSDPFEPLPRVADGTELRARWDSDAYPAGEYEFRAIAYDLAGNAVVGSRRANGAEMALSNPLKATTALSAGFRVPPLHGRRCVRHGAQRRCARGATAGPGREESLRIVPYGSAVRLEGRLGAGLSTALGGVPVRVVERFAPGAEPATRTSRLETAADGGFSIDLAPGPSREVEAVFDGGRTLARSASERLELQVRSGVRLLASAAAAKVGGPPLVFRGEVLAPAGTIPGGGMPVQLQFRLPGLPWSEFRTVQTDRRGRFRYAYRFSDDDSRGAVFEFRAYVPAHGDWPYEPSGSRPVVVRGE